MSMPLTDMTMLFQYLLCTMSQPFSYVSMVCESHYADIVLYFLSTFCFQSPVHIPSTLYIVSPIFCKFIYLPMFSILNYLFSYCKFSTFSNIFLYSKSSIFSKFFSFSKSSTYSKIILFSEFSFFLSYFHFLSPVHFLR